MVFHRVFVCKTLFVCREKEKEEYFICGFEHEFMDIDMLLCVNIMNISIDYSRNGEAYQLS